MTDNNRGQDIAARAIAVMREVGDLALPQRPELTINEMAERLGMAPGKLSPVVSAAYLGRWPNWQWVHRTRTRPSRYWFDERVERSTNDRQYMRGTPAVAHAQEMAMTGNVISTLGDGRKLIRLNDGTTWVATLLDNLLPGGLGS